MRQKYPSDISRETFENVLPILERARKKTRPREVDLYDVFCGVTLCAQERLSVADAAEGLSQMAHLPQLFPAME